MTSFSHFPSWQGRSAAKSILTKEEIQINILGCLVTVQKYIKPEIIQGCNLKITE